MLGLQPQELVLEPLAVDRVDGAERLVHQHHAGVGGERAGDADPLLLAARKLRRVAIGELGVETDQLDQLARPGPRARPLSQPRRFGTVAMFWAIVRCGNSPVSWIT